MARRRPNGETTRLVAALWTEGVKGEAIAAELGITCHCVGYHVRKAGLPRRGARGYPIGRVPEPKPEWPAGLPKPHEASIERRQEIARLQSQGLSVRKIAERLDVSKGCVDYHVRTARQLSCVAELAKSAS